MKFCSTIDKETNAAQGFQSISSQKCIWNCVAVVDGYNLQITTPSKYCRFVFIGVAGPGAFSVREAVTQVSLGNLIESLPGLYRAIGDCLYTPTEHLIPVFHADQALNIKNDNFSFLCQSTTN
jgi:hypothetical protein